VGPDDTDFGVELNHNGVQFHYKTDHEIDDIYDINGNEGIWVYETNHSSLVDVPGNPANVSSYTAIWTPHRQDAEPHTDTATATKSGQIPQW
jgi:hypothetical protein